MEDKSNFNMGTIDAVMREQALSSNVFSDFLVPARKEARQILEQYSMDLVEPTLKMQGLKAAGINPLTAAAGLAGSGGSSQVPQPAQSVNPIGDLSGAVESAAGAANSVAGAIGTLSKLAPEIEEISSRAKKNLASAGLDKVNTDAVITDNKYRSENWEAELNVKRQSYQNMKQELTNMKATHREIMTRCDEMISQIELNGSQKEYYDAMQLRIQEDLRWQKALNDWCLENKLMIRDSGVDGYIFNMLYNEAPDSDVDAFFDSFYNYCRERNYATTKGVRNAEIDTAFDKAFNEALANEEIRSKFAPYFANIDVIKQNLIDLYKSTIDSPNGPIAFVTKALHMITAGLLGSVGAQQDSHNAGFGEKPGVSPKSSK